MKSGNAAQKLESVQAELPDPSKAFSTIFKSRRFGTTLEIDPLIGHTKICSLNCVHCTLGETSLRLNRIKRDLNFLSVDDLNQGLEKKLLEVSQFDSLIVAGNGEPTLHPQFPEFTAAFLQTLESRNLRMKTWLLTNGAHFDNRRSVDAANMYSERVLKIDAGTERMFKQVSQPLARVTLNRIMAAAHQLKDVWLSSTFFDGRINNTSPAEIDEWIEVVGIIRPKGVFIQTTKHKTPHAISSPCSVDDLFSIAAKLERKSGLKAKVIE